MNYYQIFYSFITVVGAISGLSVFQYWESFKISIQQEGFFLVTIAVLSTTGLTALLLSIIGVQAWQLYELRRRNHRPSYTTAFNQIASPSKSQIGISAHVKLYDDLNQFFDLSGLQEIIFELGIDEEWEGNKSEVSMELVLYLWRRNRIEELYKIVSIKRPASLKRGQEGR